MPVNPSDPIASMAAGYPGLESLDAMFNAKRVAIIGASADAGKIGGIPVVLLKDHFRGQVVPVNPNRDSIAGLSCVKSIGQIAPAPDLAIVAVPAAQAESAIAEALACGVKSIVLFTAGFGEIDDDGLKAQQRLAAMCRAAGGRLLGPNSLGFINFNSGLYATFSSALANVWPKTGPVGIASQSGAAGTYLMAIGAESGIGFSRFMATGNEADIDVADCIAWMATDPETSVILAYMEGCRDGARLRQALELARRAGKPVIALKPGATDVGLAAVKSHTGMLAGSKQVFDAVLRSHGAWPARSIEEAVDLACACSLGRYPNSPDMAIVTPSGGVGIMLADAAIEAGLAVPALPVGAQTAIKTLLPLSSPTNPVDTTAQISNDYRLYGSVIDIVAGQTDIPALVLFMAHMGKSPKVTDLLNPMLTDIARRYPERLLCLITRASPAFKEAMSTLGYLVFEDPSRAIAAIAGLRYFARNFARPAEQAIIGARLERALIERAAADPAEGARLLAQIGVPQIRTTTAATVDDAVTAAKTAGFPVVLKIDSPDIAHKTEAGGVHLNLADAAAVRRAWAAMMDSARQYAPKARIKGATVSPMLQGGIETIIGTQNDPDFGAVVMFGLGGIAAEALKDVVFAPAPLGLAAAHSMIEAIKARAVFHGWRGAPPADLDTLAKTICALGAFAAAHVQDVDSIEINPFIALPEGGAALDLLIQLRS
jgi:acyl-CoA synthetase (NDP forming)